jgi:hypothetical protein
MGRLPQPFQPGAGRSFSKEGLPHVNQHRQGKKKEQNKKNNHDLFDKRHK